MPTILKDQKGIVAPPLIILLVILIATAGFLVMRNLPVGEPQATPDKGAEGLSMDAIDASSSATPSATIKPGTKKASPTPAAKSTASPSSNSESTSSNNNSGSTSSSSNSSNNSTSTTTTQTTNTTATAAPTATPAPASSETFSNGGLNVKASCNGSDLNLYISGNVASPNSSDTGIWMVLEDKSNGQTMTYEYTGNQGQPTSHVAANIPPTGPIRGSSLSLSGDGRNYVSKAYAAPFTYGTPSLSNVITEVSFSKKCP